MSDIHSDNGGAAGSAVSNLPEFTVSEISQAVKRTIEGAFGRLRVRGEVSGFKRAASGHLYMSLKDEAAVLDAVCWRATASRLAFPPEDGLEMVFTGQLTTYPGRSKYQLVIEEVEPAGEGALMALLEKRRKALAAEGLFDDQRKQELPFLPELIGVVTSPSGAVIRDILHRLADRFPRHVLIWPVAVQGTEAAAQIAAAITGFNRLAPGGPVPRPDLLIVARGGGSLEDLWAFNEEIVVRAAAASEIPLISAVGHETDTTLIDFAAGVRAPTPTAAAEMAVPVRAELAMTVSDLERRAAGAVTRRIEGARIQLLAAERGLRSPRELLGTAMQRLGDLTEDLRKALVSGLEMRKSWLAEAAARLHPSHVRREIKAERSHTGELARRLAAAMAHLLRDFRTTLDGQAKLLDSLSYERVLERGYAVVRDLSGQPVTSAAATHPGKGLAITFHDGTAEARVTGPTPKSARPPARHTTDRQGKLL